MGPLLPPSLSTDNTVDSAAPEDPTGVHPAVKTVPSARSRWIPSVAAVSIAVLVVLPWTAQGWLLLLDWTPGPQPSISRAAHGLDGSLQASLPLGILLAGSKLVGAATFGWLLIAVALAVAGIAAGRLVGGSALQQSAAGALYAVNPLVFDRIFAGHVAFLAGYAVLPLAVASLVRWGDDISWRGMRPALWLAALIGFTPHFLWIGCVVLAAHVAVRRFRCRSLAWAALVTVLTLAMSSYFIVPSIGRPAPLQVGQSDLVAFQTRADPTLGLAPNVAGLYGFWRAEPRLPKEVIAGWPVFLSAIALLAGAGLWKASRLTASRHLARVVALSGVAGYILALGDQGPTGPVFRWLFEQLPGFAIMREPQKFAALLALGYAAGFGFGMEAVAGQMRARGPRLGVVALAFALPVLYTPTLFLGLGGQIDVASYPASWYAADRVMGEGDGRLLFLPWHQYLSFPFTGRVIANPADNFFRRDVIIGDNVELADMSTASRLRRSEYLEFLYAHGAELCRFGRLVSSLGVEYVVLAKTVDFTSYSWLDRQADLKVVLDRPELTLYRNEHYSGLGFRSPDLGRAADWGDLVSQVNTGSMPDVPYAVDALRPGPITTDTCRASPTIAPRGNPVQRASDTSYRVAPGPAGVVSIAEPFDPSWRLRDGRPFELASGVVGFLNDGRAGTARFGHWDRIRAGYAVSGLTCFALLAMGHIRPSARGTPRSTGAVCPKRALLGDRGARPPRP